MKFLRKEYRIVMPLTLDEYHIAQLWSVAEASKNETGGGEGIEVVENQPYTKDGLTGQYTKKLFHLQSRVPKFIKMIAPKGSMEVLEEAWNAYPSCKTVVTNPAYMADNFEICIETIHLPDRGQTENVHKLPAKDWSETEVVLIDIANNDEVSKNDYKKETDPTLFKSTKTDRGPLSRDWIQQLKSAQHSQSSSSSPPFMCAYKLVSCRFKWFGLQGKVENYIHKVERRLFHNFHRQAFCWMDQWYGMTIKDIRDWEEKTKHELDDMRSKGNIKGMVADEEI